MAHEETWLEQRTEGELYEGWAERTISALREQLRTANEALSHAHTAVISTSETLENVVAERDAARAEAESLRGEKSTRLELGRYLVRLRKLAEDVRDEREPLARALKANLLVADTLNISRAFASTAVARVCTSDAYRDMSNATAKADAALIAAAPDLLAACEASLLSVRASAVDARESLRLAEEHDFARNISEETLAELRGFLEMTRRRVALVEAAIAKARGADQLVSQMNELTAALKGGGQ